MTFPFPFPLDTDPLLSDDFTAFADNGWVATGDAVLVDNWFDDVDQILLFAEYLGFWGNNPAVEQSPGARSTRITKTYTGLPANAYVTVQVDVAFYAQDFGAAGKWVGMEVDGVQFAPNVAASGGGAPNAGQVIGYGTTSAGGELTVAFGVDDLTVSCDLHILFDNLTISTPAAELADIIIDSANLFYENTAPISITRGGFAFDAQEEYEEYDFDGKTAPVAGCEEVVAMRPVLRGNFMMTSERHISIYRPDGSWANSAYGRTFTPAAMRAALGAGVYLNNVRCIWKRARGDFIQVRFPMALCKRYGIGALDTDEGLIPVEIEARQDLSTGTPASQRLYYIDILPIGATL